MLWNCRGFPQQKRSLTEKKKKKKKKPKDRRDWGLTTKPSSLTAQLKQLKVRKKREKEIEKANRSFLYSLSKGNSNPSLPKH
jgi:hypothetical protein